MSSNENPRHHQLKLLGALSAAVAATCPIAATAANPAACSAWNASIAYTAGAIVVDKGKTYKANWWTQGNEPIANNGVRGTGEPWTLSSGCPAAPTPPAPVPAPPPKSPPPPPAPAPTPPAPTPPAGGLDVNAPPGKNFNLAPFFLQLPTGSADNPNTISSAALATFTDSPYFYTDKTDGSMVMADPAQGWTTSGSLHPRVEFRENATWTTSGTNVLTATVAVAKVPSHTTIAQIFQGTGPSKPLCELQVSSTGVVQLLLENTNQGGSSTVPHITTVSLGKKFDYLLQLEGTTITVTVNGVTTTFPMPASFIGERFYFKAGDYDRSAVEGTPLSTVGTIVQFYALAIKH